MDGFDYRGEAGIIWYNFVGWYYLFVTMCDKYYFSSGNVQLQELLHATALHSRGFYTA